MTHVLDDLRWRGLLAHHTDLDALRERDDFRKFVDELPKSSPVKQE